MFVRCHLQKTGEPEPAASRVVARFRDGKVVKGLTVDFRPYEERFHIVENGATPREIQVPELKGVYFVKDLDGDLGHAKSNIFDPADLTPGRKIRVLFKDGEVLMGYTPDFLSTRPGFFVLPADLRSNSDRCYIVAAATERISLIGGP
jgi:hypothetical protein